MTEPSQIINIDWDEFKVIAKRYGGLSPDKYFERMCYLIFCIETGNSKGIEKDYNNAHIETKPVLLEGTLTGFQSKFYTTTLSKNISDILKCINGAKKDYPRIQKIILFTNQEHTTGKRTNTDAKYKVNANNYAKHLNITLEWRTNSYFEAIYLQNEEIKKLVHQFTDLKKAMEEKEIKEAKTPTQTTSLNDVKEAKVSEHSNAQSYYKSKDEPSINIDNLTAITRISTPTHQKTTIDETKQILNNAITLIGYNQSTRDLVSDIEDNPSLQLILFEIFLNNPEYENRTNKMIEHVVNKLITHFSETKKLQTDSKNKELWKRVQGMYVQILNKHSSK